MLLILDLVQRCEMVSEKRLLMCSSHEDQLFDKRNRIVYQWNGFEEI